MTVQVVCRLENGGLTIDCRAKSGRDTLCNLTNRAYFNPSGHASGSVLGQEIQILGDFYTLTESRQPPPP